MIPTECADIDSDKDGVYTIIPKGGVKEVSVFCMMRGQNNKWTVRSNTGILAYFVFVFCLRSRRYISIFIYSPADNIVEAFYIIAFDLLHAVTLFLLSYFTMSFTMTIDFFRY